MSGAEELPDHVRRNREDWDRSARAWVEPDDDSVEFDLLVKVRSTV